MGDKINRGRQRNIWRDELQQYWGNVNWYMRGRNRELWRQHARLLSCSGLIMAEDGDDDEGVTSQTGIPVPMLNSHPTITTTT